jgi:tetratricopeptide (TPR) repeat protein
MSHALALSGPLWVAQVALGFAVVVGAAACVVRRQTPALIPLSFGLLWFFAALFPSITAGNIVYEHWLYLPMAGLMLGAAEAFARWADARKAFAPRERKVFLVLLAATALMLGALTARQNLVWRDSETLYQNVIRSGDPAPNAHLNLGAAYAGRGGYEAALEEYKLAERDFALSNDTFTGDGRPPLETARARALLALGGAAREDEALRHLERALTKDPLYLAALDTLASYYAKQGNTRMAEETKARAEAVRQKIGSLMKPDY